jgi:hypothetical protein
MGFPDDDEHGDRLHDDIRLALRFALTCPGGPHALVQWRRSQTSILNQCVQKLRDLNTWILQTAHRPKAARNIAPHANVALIACTAHVMQWPDQTIAADFCNGFPLLGTATDSGLFRQLEQKDPVDFEQSQIRPTLITNVERAT